MANPGFFPMTIEDLVSRTCKLFKTSESNTLSGLDLVIDSTSKTSFNCSPRPIDAFFRAENTFDFLSHPLTSS